MPYKSAWKGGAFEIEKTQVGLRVGGIANDFNKLLVGILSNIDLVNMQVVFHGWTYYMLTEAENARYRVKDLTSQLLTFGKG